MASALSEAAPCCRCARGCFGRWLPALLLAACPGLLQAHDPESDAHHALAEVAARGLRFEVAGQSVSFAELDVSEVAVDSPSVLFHAVGTGTLGAATLGYYGAEHVILRSRDGQLVPEVSWLPKLAGVLAALAARDAAVKARNTGALAALAAAGYRDGAIAASDLPVLLVNAAAPQPPSAISVRIDGDRAEVSEVRGFGAGSGRWAASLVRTADFWRFASGLL